MTQPKPQTETDLAGWRAGQRVSRKDTEELGTIVEANGKIKVKWDGGRTSYFRRNMPANVRLKEPAA
jgi:hypothetical protein